MGKLTNHLLDQPKPRTLKDWAWQAMVASFPADSDIAIVWGDVLQYLGWLDSLAVLDSNPTTGG